MIWRFSRQTCFACALHLSTRLSPRAGRRLSTLPISNQSVASVLALPALDGDQTPRKVVVTGHVRTIRNQKRHSFVEIGDGSTIHSLQALLNPSHAASLGTGTAVTISGLWRASPKGTEQSHELHAEEVRILGTTDAEVYPIQKKYHSAEYLRTIPHLRLRTPFNALLARLRSECEYFLLTFFRSSDFVRLQPPLITSSDCEGAGEVFALRPKDAKEAFGTEALSMANEFFRAPKFLTVSSQLHLEAFVHEHQKVWALSPTFRAEKSDTPRHLSEFYMLEAEIRIESLRGLMDLVEDMIRDVAVKLLSSEVGKELLVARHGLEPDARKEMPPRSEVMQRRWSGLERASWPRISYSEAMRLLQGAAEAGQIEFQYRPEWSTGLHLEHERYIASEIGQGSPVFVTDYPKALKPFYMLPSDFDRGAADDQYPTVACFDLLLPEACEVVGGSLREHRLEPLLQAMRKHGLSPMNPSTPQVEKRTPSTGLLDASNLDWYADLRRYGSVPHGGFGLGFDRLLGYLAAVDNVRDVAPWPRYYGKCDC